VWDEEFAVSETRKRGSEVISGLLSLGSTNPFPAQATVSSQTRFARGRERPLCKSLS
jgi:hypothetical protein